MQPINSLPINTFLSVFPVEMRSVENSSTQSAKTLVQTGGGVIEEPSSDLQAHANIE